MCAGNHSILISVRLDMSDRVGTGASSMNTAIRHFPQGFAVAVNLKLNWGRVSGESWTWKS